MTMIDAPTLNIEALYSAINENKLEDVRRLLAISDIRDKAADQENALLVTAATRGSAEIVRELLKLPEIQKNAAVKNNIVLKMVALRGYADIVCDLLKNPQVQATAISKENIYATVQAMLFFARNKDANTVESFLVMPEVGEYALQKNDTATQIKNFLTEIYIKILLSQIQNGDIEKVRHFLSMPQISKIAAEQDNRLLKVAVFTNYNPDIIRLLLTNPTVRDKAASNDFVLKILKMAIKNQLTDIALGLLTIEAVRAKVARDDNALLKESIIHFNDAIFNELLTIPAVKANAIVGLEVAFSNMQRNAVQRISELSEVHETVKRKPEAWQKVISVLEKALKRNEADMVRHLLKMPVEREFKGAENHHDEAFFLVSESRIAFDDFERSNEKDIQLWGKTFKNELFKWEPVFEWAIQKGHKDIVRHLLTLERVRRSHFILNSNILETVAKIDEDMLIWAIEQGYGDLVHKVISDQKYKAMIKKIAEKNLGLTTALSKGNEEIFDDLLQCPEIQDSAIATANFADTTKMLFQAAIKNHKKIVRSLLKILKLRSLVATQNNFLLTWAIDKDIKERDCSDIVIDLLNIPEVRKNAAVKDNLALAWAILKGQNDMALDLLTIQEVRDNAHVKNNMMLKKVAKKPGANDIVKALLGIPQVRDPETLNWAVKESKTLIVQQLLTYESMRNMAAPIYRDLLLDAIKNNHEEVALELLKIPEAENYIIATASHSDLLQNLAVLVNKEPQPKVALQLLTFPSMRGAAAASSNNRLLKWAAIHGLEDIILDLLNIPEVKANAAALNNFSVKEAAQKGLQKSVRELLALTTVRSKAATGNNYLLKTVITRGWCDIAIDLLKIPEVQNKIVESSNDVIFFAANRDHVSVVREALKILPCRSQAAGKNNQLLVWACSKGHKDIVCDLLTLPEVRANASAQENYALREAARRGWTDIVQDLMLISNVPDNADDYDNEAFRLAAAAGREEVVKILLQNPLVQMKIGAKQYEALRYAASNGHTGVVRLLLENDLVKTNAAILDNQALKLALDHGHNEIAGLLREIQAVKDHEATHPIFARGTIGHMAQDNENATRAVDARQIRGMSIILDRYKDKLDKEGVEAILNRFKIHVREQYWKNPIKQNGEPVGIEYNPHLPQEIKEQFYRHHAHTVYRYLSSPNLWLSPSAQYIVTGTGTAAIATKERRAMAAIFLALTDPTFELPTGYNSESIMQFFIEQIAGLGRAHNWDNTRKKTIVINGKSREVEEEYDNMKGDDPSCYTGVNKRLVQVLEVLLQNIAPEYRALSASIVKNYFTSLLIAEGDDNALFSRLNKLETDKLKSIETALTTLVVVYMGDRKELNAQEKEALALLEFDKETIAKFTEECARRFSEDRIKGRADPEPKLNTESFSTYEKFIQYLAEEGIIFAYYEIIISHIKKRITILEQAAIEKTEKQAKTLEKIEAGSRAKKSQKDLEKSKVYTPLRKMKVKTFDKPANDDASSVISIPSWSELRTQVDDEYSMQLQFSSKENGISKEALAALTKVRDFLHNGSNEDNFEGLRALLIEDQPSGEQIGFGAAVKTFNGERLVNMLFDDLFKRTSNAIEKIAAQQTVRKQARKT